jgi:hypothetical protein
MDISIANKLEVLPGNIIMLPGCEPSSAITMPVLDVLMNCKAPTIKLSAALAAIPQATVVFWSNTGDGVTRKYFVLPDGPPVQFGSCCGGADWYQILRDAATNETPVQEQEQVCGYGGYMQCQSNCG